jgi:hypothetical protein
MDMDEIKEMRAFWWLLGGFFFVLGIRHLAEGRESDALMFMAFGLVLLAVGSRKLRQSLLEFFVALFFGLARKIS